MKKILISDYDNTFYTTEEQLYKNIEYIKKFQEKGNIFVISTSRSWKSLKQEIDKYKIPFDYLCCNTGGTIFDNKGSSLFVGNISDSVINKVENILEKLNLNNFSITRYGKYKEYEEKINEILGYKIKGNREEIENLRKELKNVLNNEFEIILKNEKQYSKLFLNFKLNTKENGIEKLIKILPEVEYKIITVGDDDIDFNMLKKYDGYRMNNSSKLLTENINKTVNSIEELLKIS